jgi:hypothetical protein
MIQEFNQWWNKDDLTNDNLYRKDTPMYWAWEGWQAGARAEREACAKVCEEASEKGSSVADWCAANIRARGQL